MQAALITGANKGLGLETARQLGRLGFRILAGARDESRGQEAVESLRAEGIEADLVLVDMASPASIEKASAEVQSRFGRLDVLVNNAAVMLDGRGPGAWTAATVSQEVLHQTFQANVFGLIQLTQSLLPLLKESEAGRIVNLTTNLACLSLHADPKSDIYNVKSFAYNTSKMAVNSFTIHLAYDLRRTAVKVNAAHPGWVKTEMGGPSAPMELEEGAKTTLWLATLPPDGPTGGIFHLQTPLPF